MKLQSYLASHGYPAIEFGRRLGVSKASVSRYASGARIPSPAVMRRIVAETEGAVTANDFYDLPALATTRQARTVVTVEISEDLVGEAERLGTDLTAVIEQALEAAIRDARRAKWREENAEAIKEANEELARNGLWSDGVRLF
jgi:antitoxin CcdA